MNYKVELDFTGKSDSISIEIGNHDLGNESDGFWVNDFVNNFASNWLQDPSQSEKAYADHKTKIEKRQFDSMPPIVFSEEFVNTLYQMINLQYQDTFLPEALTIIYSFYIYDEEIELRPLQNIFIQIESIFQDAEDEIKDQILKILGMAVLHSQEAHDFIIELFPIKRISELFHLKPDLSDSISYLVQGYSRNKNDNEKSLDLIKLSIQIFCQSFSIKISKKKEKKKLPKNISKLCKGMEGYDIFEKIYYLQTEKEMEDEEEDENEDEVQQLLNEDEDENGKMHIKKYKIIESKTIMRSLYSIQAICINMNQDSFSTNSAIKLLYENEVDILINEILRDQSNFRDYILKLVLFMYENARMLPSQKSFDILDGVFDSTPMIPRIDYTIFISFLIDQENYENSKRSVIYCLILSEKILCNQLAFSKNKDNIYDYIFKKNLLGIYQLMIENGVFKLKVSTVSSLYEILSNIPVNLMEQILEIKLAFTLIDEIEVDAPNLTINILKCINFIIRSSNKFGLPVQEIFDYFKENVLIDFSKENESVQEEFRIYNSIISD